MAVPSLKSSWAKRQQDRADRAALLVAQKEIDETIRAEKRAAQEKAEVASAGARAGTDGAALAALDPLTPKAVSALTKVSSRSS